MSRQLTEHVTVGLKAYIISRAWLSQEYPEQHVLGQTGPTACIVRVAEAITAYVMRAVVCHWMSAKPCS
jgi:hypothetical protein